MNIGYIVEMYRDNSTSGIEVWTRRLVNYYRELGMQAQIYSYENGLDINLPNKFKTVPNIRELLLYPYVGRKNVPGKIEQNHELIHYAAPFSTAWHKTKIPGVVSTHYIISRQIEMLSRYLPVKYKLFFNPAVYAAYLAVEKKGFHNADMITVCRESYKEYIVERMGVPEKRIVVIKYGIDNQKFIPAQSVEEKERMAIYVGRGSLPKGFDTLVAAAPKIKGKVVAVASRIPEDLRAIANTIPNLEIKAGISEQELIDLYRKATVFVMPSLTEGAPISTLEAMSSGLPVVCTVEGSGEYIVEGETGYHFDFKDENTCAERVNYLLDHPEMAFEFGKRNRHKVDTQLTLPVIANQILDVYRKLV